MSQTATQIRRTRGRTPESPRATGRRTAPRAPWPPLENGDRLKQREFHRRYLRCPENVWAQLVEGTVYMSSPVRFESHGLPHALIMAWLSHYWVHVPSARVGDNTTVILDDDNEVQPDAFIRREAGDGGASAVKKDYVVGPPELVVEVAGSSVSMDMNQKREAYRRNGVQEYLVWRVYDQAIDWWRLEDGQYVAIEPDDEGICHSQVFPGLALDAAALIAGDLAKVVAALDATQPMGGAGDHGQSKAAPAKPPQA